MKKLFYILPFVFFLSCGDDKATKIQNLEKAIADIETTEPAKAPEVIKQTLLFKASGSEPGWSVEMYTDKLRLLLDYGKDSVIISDNFEEIDSEGEYSYSHHDSKVEVNIKNGPCVHDGSGESLSKKVEVKRGSKIYKGCGEFVK